MYSSIPKRAPGAPLQASGSVGQIGVTIWEPEATRFKVIVIFWPQLAELRFKLTVAGNVMPAQSL